MKCPECGTENDEGMNFYTECCTALKNHCPNCNKDYPLSVKFCGICRYKFGGEGTSSGLSMGSKNVIAGDVNSSVTNNTTNNTTVYNDITNNDPILPKQNP
ncbi:MAG: zinc ribbon domain-containing protein [Treponema sp.]|nr:zinc ribbon domain-containing protein [Spirochaetia bacterium]MDD7460138.1 zinc ribbon domain-containing protein [Spirochaetales bacterium]MDY5810901.1 zinc ribbon domain-containing protein [Treponema sp.]